MKPIHTTLFMGLIAAVSCVAAAFFYPWPDQEAITETSGSLFESFEKQVWTIKIVRYDRETEGIKSFQLRKKAQKWTMPNKSDFVANGQNISVVASCLDEKAILGEQSEDQQDHEKFGVLDPVDFMNATNRDSIGVKVTLEDVNRTPMASLIVGDAVRGSANQYYVRKPGQPKVYIVEFQPEILTTQFGAWIDPNLLGLQTSQNPDGALLDQVDIQNYRLTGSEKEFSYRIMVRPFEQNPKKMLEMEVPDKDQWQAVGELNPDQRLQFGRSVQAIQFTQLVDVRPKEKKLAEIMTANLSLLKERDFTSAAKKGFRLSRTDDELTFDGTGGKLTVSTQDGVNTTMLFGNLATSTESSADALNYDMIIVADVQEAMKSKPVAPTPGDGEELSEDEARTYARAVEEWEEKSKSAARRAAEINRLHGNWYYIISEDVLEMLRPTVAGLPSNNEADDDEGSDDETAEPDNE